MRMFAIAAALLLVACGSTMPEEDHHVTTTAAPAQAAPALQSDEFDAPAASSVAEAEKTSGPEAAHGLYVCPMHPEVTSHEPGKCPKCGMTLVKKE